MNSIHVVFESHPQFVNDLGVKWWDISEYFSGLYNRYTFPVGEPYIVYATERPTGQRNYLLVEVISDDERYIINQYTTTEAIYMALEVRLFARKD